MLNLKQILEKAYVARLYKKSRFMFVVIVLFFSGTILANVLLIPFTPFFTWDMFSSPLQKNKPVIFYQVLYNQKILPPGNTWKSAQQITLINQLKYYADFIKNNRVEYYRTSLESWVTRHPNLRWLTPSLPNSSAHFDAFPGWYKNYMSVITGEEIKSVALVKNTAIFLPDYSIQVQISDTLVTIQ